MARVTRWVLLAAVLCLTITACKREALSSPPVGLVSVPEHARAVTSFASQPKRYLAIRHEIEIETPESDLQKTWTATVNFCATLRCEVLSSGIVNRTPGSPPSAALSVRVAPDDLPKLLDSLGKSGTLVRQSTEAEDKTATVIDVEAKLRNLTEFRDSLRSLLTRSNANLHDLIEVRKQLADVQSELDSETTKRKVLADETEKIAVNIRFNVHGYTSSVSGFGKIGAAFNEAFSVFAESVAVLITFTFAALPWAAALILAGWLIAKALRYRRSRRSAK